MAEEKRFEGKVKRFLHSVGIYAAGTPKQDMINEQHGWYLKHWGGGMSKSGIPDLIMCVNGIFMAPELKAPDGKPSDLQKKNISMINQGNGIGMILYPEGFEQFKNIVKGALNCNFHIQDLEALKAVNSSSKCIILKE